MPKVSVGVFIEDSPCGKWSQLIKVPIYFAFVLSTLIFRPAQLDNCFRTVNKFLTKSKSKRIKVISSAYWLIFISLLSTFMSFVFESFHILFAKVSVVVINK